MLWSFWVALMLSLFMVALSSLIEIVAPKWRNTFLRLVSMAVPLPYWVLEIPISFSSLYLSVSKRVTEMEYFKDCGPNCYQIMIKEAMEASFVLWALVNSWHLQPCGCDSEGMMWTEAGQIESEKMKERIMLVLP